MQQQWLKFCQEQNLNFENEFGEVECDLVDRWIEESLESEQLEDYLRFEEEQNRCIIDCQMNELSCPRCNIAMIMAQTPCCWQCPACQWAVQLQVSKRVIMCVECNNIVSGKYRGFE